MSSLPVLVWCNGRRGLVRCVLPASLSLALSSAGAAPATGPHQVEVFTAAPLEVTAAGLSPSEGELQVYRLDSIQHIERRLSADLTGDPELAKRTALTRLQQLDQPTTLQMQQAAVGLAKAVEYGIDRYPAIVFDETAVVYGVTDLAEAMSSYRRWQEAGGS